MLHAANYTEVALNTPPLKLGARSSAFAIGPPESNCKTAFVCSVPPEKNFHICCLTKNGVAKPVFKADSNDNPIMSMFIQETESSQFVWYMSTDPFGCPRVFRVLCDLSGMQFCPFKIKIATNTCLAFIVRALCVQFIHKHKNTIKKYKYGSQMPLFIACAKVRNSFVCIDLPQFLTVIKTSTSHLNGNTDLIIADRAL